MSNECMHNYIIINCVKSHPLFYTLFTSWLFHSCTSSGVMILQLLRSDPCLCVCVWAYELFVCPFGVSRTAFTFPDVSVPVWKDRAVYKCAHLVSMACNIDLSAQIQQSVLMATEPHPGLSEAVGRPQEDEGYWLGRKVPGTGGRDTCVF